MTPVTSRCPNRIAAQMMNGNVMNVSGSAVPSVATPPKTSTLTQWVKTTQTGSNNHQQAPAITGVDQQGTTGDINWGTLNAAGQIGIYVGDTGGVYSTSAVNDGTWHNVAMTRDAHVARLRKKLDKAGASVVVATRRGIGFVLEPVSPAGATT